MTVDEAKENIRIVAGLLNEFPGTPPKKGSQQVTFYVFFLAPGKKRRDVKHVTYVYIFHVFNPVMRPRAENRPKHNRPEIFTHTTIQQDPYNRT